VRGQASCAALRRLRCWRGRRIKSNIGQHGAEPPCFKKQFPACAGIQIQRSWCPRLLLTAFGSGVKGGELPFKALPFRAGTLFAACANCAIITA